MMSMQRWLWSQSTTVCMVRLYVDGGMHRSI